MQIGVSRKAISGETGRVTDMGSLLDEDVDENVDYASQWSFDDVTSEEKNAGETVVAAVRTRKCSSLFQEYLAENVNFSTQCSFNFRTNTFGTPISVTKTPQSSSPLDFGVQYSFNFVGNDVNDRALTHPSTSARNEEVVEKSKETFLIRCSKHWTKKNKFLLLQLPLAGKVIARPKIHTANQTWVIWKTNFNESQTKLRMFLTRNLLQF